MENKPRQLLRLELLEDRRLMSGITLFPQALAFLPLPPESPILLKAADPVSILSAPAPTNVAAVPPVSSSMVATGGSVAPGISTLSSTLAPVTQTVFSTVPSVKAIISPINTIASTISGPVGSVIPLLASEGGPITSVLAPVATIPSPVDNLVTATEGAVTTGAATVLVPTETMVAQILTPVVAVGSNLDAPVNNLVASPLAGLETKKVPASTPSQGNNQLGPSSPSLGSDPAPVSLTTNSDPVPPTNLSRNQSTPGFEIAAVPSPKNSGAAASATPDTPPSSPVLNQGGLTTAHPDNGTFSTGTSGLAASLGLDDSNRGEERSYAGPLGVQVKGNFKSPPSLLDIAPGVQVFAGLPVFLGAVLHGESESDPSLFTNQEKHLAGKPASPVPGDFDLVAGFLAGEQVVLEKTLRDFMAQLDELGKHLSRTHFGLGITCGLVVGGAILVYEFSYRRRRSAKPGQAIWVPSSTDFTLTWIPGISDI